MMMRRNKSVQRPVEYDDIYDHPCALHTKLLSLLGRTGATLEHSFSLSLRYICNMFTVRRLTSVRRNQTFLS